MKPQRASMQLVLALVRHQRMLLSVEEESAARDAIGVSPNQGTEVHRIPNVVVEAVVARSDVRDSAVTVGNAKRNDSPAEGNDGDLQPAAARERESRLQFGLMGVGRVETKMTPAPWSMPHRVDAVMPSKYLTYDTETRPIAPNASTPPSIELSR